MPIHYLGFTRPPPSALSCSQAIQVAPTITNDLRDAVFSPEESVSINVAWLLHAPQSPTQAGGSSTSALADLQILRYEDPIQWKGPSTAWKNATFTAPSSGDVHKALAPLAESNGAHNTPSASYRTCPPLVRLAMWVHEGASRSVLRPQKAAKHRHHSAPGSRSVQTPDLKALCIDPRIVTQSMLQSNDVFLPALTPPIALHGLSPPSSAASAERVEAPAKLAQLSRLWRLPSPDIDGSIVEVRENNTFDLDKHVWDASLPMVSCLLSGQLARPTPAIPHTEQQNQPQAWQHVLDILHSSQDVVVLELGAGTGLLSLCLHRHLSALPLKDDGHSQPRPRRCRIFASDLEGSTAFTAANMSLNGIAPPSVAESETTPAYQSDDSAAPSLRHVTTSVLPLDWFSKELPRELRDALEPADSGGDEWTQSETEATSTHESSSLEHTPPSKGGSPARPDLLILASDCSYNPDTYDAFCGVIRRLFALYPRANAGKTSDSRCGCLISKKHRHEDEGRLWEVLRSATVRHDAAGSQAEIAEPTRLGVDLIDGWPGPGFDESADGGNDGDEGKWGIFAVSTNPENT